MTQEEQFRQEHLPVPSAARQLINDPSRVVPELIEGLLLTRPGLTRLSGLNVVLRGDFEALRHRQVAVISGGGSGHEPAHAGYVGPGLLTAAVAGDVFASPSTASVLAAIRAVTGEAGCLLIVKNYTGDRLNFGLAAEQARSEYGLKVSMVVVSDDVALPDAPQPRGIAGTVFVHKVAGAAAEAGLSLEEVRAEAERVAGQVASLGLALSGCTLPGQAPDTRLGVGEIELGLGIHGEEGIERGQHDTADALTGLLLGTLLSSRRGEGLQGRVALLLNNLGTVTPLELLIVTRAAAAGLARQGLWLERLYTGSHMTSLDMKGYSLSLLPLDDALLARLDAPADAPGWTAGALPSDPARAQAAPAVQEEALPARAAPTPESARLEAAIRAAAQSLIDHEAQLTAWDKQVGDGDCGTTLRRGAEWVLADLPGYPLQDARGTLLGLARSVSASMGGSTGVLYAILFRAAAGAVQAGEGGWAALFGAGVSALGQYGGAGEGDRTMMDALLPARRAYQATESLAQAAGAAETGAEATRSMTRAGAGRSAYLSAAALQGTPDPGAAAVAYWLRAVAGSGADSGADTGVPPT